MVPSGATISINSASGESVGTHVPLRRRYTQVEDTRGGGYVSRTRSMSRSRATCFQRSRDRPSARLRSVKTYSHHTMARSLPTSSWISSTNSEVAGRALLWSAMMLYSPDWLSISNRAQHLIMRFLNSFIKAMYAASTSKNIMGAAVLLPTYSRGTSLENPSRRSPSLSMYPPIWYAILLAEAPVLTHTTLLPNIPARTKKACESSASFLTARIVRFGFWIRY